MTPEVYEFAFFEQQRPTLMARVVGADGSPIQQADVVSIAVSFRSYDTTATEHQTDAPDKTAVVFDALQTPDNDPRWLEDEIGYNFLYTPALGKFDQDDTYTYLVEIVFTTSDDIIPVVFKAEQMAVASLT
jgi:hypothetical protein